MSPAESKENLPLDESSQKRSNSQVAYELVSINKRGAQRKFRGAAQRVVLPKNSSFLSISGMNQIIDSGSKEKRSFGGVPFRDLTENHNNIMKNENKRNF